MYVQSFVFNIHHLQLCPPLPLFNASMITGRQPLPFFFSQQLLARRCNKSQAAGSLLVQCIKSLRGWGRPWTKA